MTTKQSESVGYTSTITIRSEEQYEKVLAKFEKIMDNRETDEHGYVLETPEDTAKIMNLIHAISNWNYQDASSNKFGKDIAANRKRKLERQKRGRKN